MALFPEGISTRILDEFEIIVKFKKDSLFLSIGSNSTFHSYSL